MSSVRRISGLGADELQDFLGHHFEGQGKRLDEAGLRTLFERGRGAPGLIVPMYRTILASNTAKGRIDLRGVEEALARWDLP